MPAFIYIVPVTTSGDGSIVPEIPMGIAFCVAYSRDGSKAIVRTTTPINRGSRSPRTDIGQIMRESEEYGLAPRDIVDRWRIGGV